MELATHNDNQPLLNLDKLELWNNIDTKPSKSTGGAKNSYEACKSLLSLLILLTLTNPCTVQNPPPTFTKRGLSSSNLAIRVVMKYLFMAKGGNSLLWQETFVKKTKILKCFPIFQNFQNHFLKHKISAPFSLVGAERHNLMFT